MRILPFIICMFYAAGIFAQSPHGRNLVYDCSYCHVSDSWKVNSLRIEFNHNETQFKLTGQHKQVDCISCHIPSYSMTNKGKKITALPFKITKRECSSCHKDIHQNTVGLDCARCHSTDNWVVRNINQLHQESRFPLTGIHLAADCQQCHKSFSNLVFEPLNIDCYSCHASDYLQTSSPNHEASGFGTDCQTCHDISAFQWSAGNFMHEFFPLTGGHNIQNCFSCHKGGAFTGLSKECISCHRIDYEAVKDPDHVKGNFPLDCTQCHTTLAFIPSTFDHSSTNFPLNGAHISTNCSSCHSEQFAGTPVNCISCHQQNYNSSINPSHTALQLPTECGSCHSTNPGWQPALFPVHDQYYLLAGAHAIIKNDCSGCHNGNYINTPNTCYGCHQNDYNNTTNPSHTAAKFPTECSDCHSQNAWKPSTFNHDGQYFPIYSGKHNNQWTNCSECHTNPNNFTVFSCIDCHEHNKTETDDKHKEVSGYTYESSACFACHPKGDAEGAFNHSITNFPLTGSHISVDCIRCHSNGYVNTPSECLSCHQQNYNASINPSHTALQLPSDCQSCHTTNPDWQPALFPLHNQFYQFSGAHAAIQNDCDVCHQGNYTTTSNTCIGCHQQDYNGTINPSHSAAQFPVTCEDCHSQNSWIPSTFNHDAQFFPIYSGEHSNEWNSCSDCHTNQNNFSEFSCINCHEHNKPEMDDKHKEVTNYMYNSANCLSCHPNGRAGKINIRTMHR